ncbi:MAG: glycosyltransferase [Candidatus Lokiarchaeota archaeon]|nr:glycosyltransferase [Candidatus Lokiarchaeota archaeon]
MKILISSQSYKDYQNYIRSKCYAIELVKSGHQVTIITTSPTRSLFYKTENINGIRVVVSPEILGNRFRMYSWGMIDTIFRTIYILLSKYDIYHFDGNHPAIILPFFVKRLFSSAKFVNEWMDWCIDVKSGFSIADKIANFYEKMTHTKIRKYFDGVVVISQFLYNETLRLGIDRSRILYLPSGCDIDKIYPCDKINVKRKYGLDVNRISLGIIGYESGDWEEFCYVYDALRILENKYNFNNFDFIVSGKHDPMTKKQQNKHQYNYKYVGWADNYNEFLSTLDIAILPLKDTKKNRAKYPNKLSDFMAAGLPIVSNPVGEVKSLHSKIKFGLLDEQYNSENLAEILYQLIRNSQLREKFGNNGRIFAETEFSWEEQSKKLLEFYHKIQGSNRNQDNHPLN